MHAHVFQSFNLSNICNQVVTTTLPFGESLYGRSYGFIMFSYILPAHVWVCAAPKDVALRVITSTGSVCPWLLAAQACMAYAS